ncbi:hypothetical protein H6771_03000 [Candidatus Peribacteria bacterium]|nr:hypothetical protein [Candidatus Peribacteria bacterium]
MNIKNTQHTVLYEKNTLVNSYETQEKITWCSGCGNHAIRNALIDALALENLTQQDVILCYDIGCNGNEADKITANTLHGLHGRVLPLAAGVKLAQPNTVVIAQAGDGATFSEGIGHLVHAVRSDYPLVFLLHNNHNYALTTGQPSALTPCGAKRSATDGHTPQRPLHPMQLIMSLEPSFYARGFSGEREQLTELIRHGIHHHGFACVEVLQSCPTYAKEADNSYYWERIRQIENRTHYDINSYADALILAHEDAKNGTFHTGVLYTNTTQKSEYLHYQSTRKDLSTEPWAEVTPRDVSPLLARL